MGRSPMEGFWIGMDSFAWLGSSTGELMDRWVG
jgi:hypothetical protein